MPRVNNLDTRVETPLPQLQEALRNLPSGQKVKCENTKEEILRTQMNLTQKRTEVYGADSHLEYIEALLMAEAEGKLEFRK